MEKLAKPDGIDRGNRHSWGAALVLAGLVLMSMFAHIPTAFAGNWPHFGYDSQYTSFNSTEQTIKVDNIAALEQKWGIGCNDGYFSVISRSPAIHGGKLYTSGAGSRLTAYDAETGKELWQFGNGNLGWAPQPVVSEDGIVFYMEESIPTYLYAVNGSTGEMIWKAPLGFDLGFNDTNLVTIDEEKNLVYLVEDDFGDEGKLFALDKSTGEVVWYKSKATDGIEFKGDYVLLKAGKIYARAEVPAEHGFTHEQIVRIDPATQDFELTYDRTTAFTGLYYARQYTLCNNKLVVGFTEHYLPSPSVVAVYDLDAPTIVWEREFSRITGQIACNTAKNILYVPTDPYLYALDAATGNEVWKYLGFGPIYNPSVANGIVYFISDTNMYALNESTGKKIFSYPLGYEGYETSQVAVINGMLFFSGNGGTCDLFALGLPNDPDLPVVRLKAVDSSVSEEGPDFGKFKILRTGSTIAPLIVNYSVSGSAQNGKDFRKLSGKITIQAGKSAASITLKPIDDSLEEGSETVKLELIENPAYRIGTPRSRVVRILDND